MFWNNLRNYGNAIALIDGDTSEVLTYEMLANEVDRWSAVLARIPRATALSPLNNNRNDVVHYLALLQSGHVPIIYSNQSPSSSIRKALETYRPGVVFGDAIRFAKAGCDIYELDVFSGAEYAVQEQLRGAMSEHLGLLMSTSGSTGSPKLVRISKASLHVAAYQVVEALGINPEDRATTSVPISHIYGLSVLHSHLACGASVVIEARSVIEKAFWNHCRDFGVSCISGVPWTYQMLRGAGADALEVSSLRTVTTTGGKIDALTALWLEEVFGSRGIDLYYMYGQTEACGRIAVLPSQMRGQKAGSVGRPVPGGRLSISDGGSVTYHGANVMMGYAQKSEDLAEGDTQSGVIETGDLGYLDDDGFLFLYGRKSRIAKIFGVRVNLDEIQDYLADRGIIASAFCDDAGCVRVNCSGVQEIQLGELQADLCQQFKTPRTALSLRVVEEVERLESGKILANPQLRGIQ